MQIVGKPKKLKSREPLILLGLRRVIQVVLPLGSGGTPVQVQVLSPAPKKSIAIAVLFFYLIRRIGMLSRFSVYVIIKDVCNTRLSVFSE
jgi:hypothetical protein